VAYRGGGLGGSKPLPRNTKLQLSPEPLTRGPLPPDPRSLCPLLNLLNPPAPNKIPGYATDLIRNNDESKYASKTFPSLNHAPRHEGSGGLGV
jgi:hypothetical protein